MLLFMPFQLYEHSSLPPAQLHPHRINHDCRQPGRQLGLTSELPHMRVRSQQSVLNRILGVCGIVQFSLGYPVKDRQSTADDIRQFQKSLVIWLTHARLCEIDICCCRCHKALFFDDLDVIFQIAQDSIFHIARLMPLEPRCDCLLCRDLPLKISVEERARGLESPF